MSQLLNEDYICKCKLVYNNMLATNTIENILLISSCVNESQLFYDSVNNNTFPIIYSPNSEKNELIELLRNKFKNGLKRITFAFHDPLNNIKTFLDNKPFFNESDLIVNQTTFSENVSFLTNLIKEFKVNNCDFLACNSLKYSNWKKYYELLNKLTNVLCGASNDKTGNIQYGANWIMENRNENIRDIYFTSSINNYSSSLAAFTIDYVNYSTTGNNASIVGVSNPPSNWNLIIPTTVTNDGTTYNVTTIGNSAFHYSSALTSVTILNSLLSIGYGAFYNCYNLTSVTFSDSVLSIIGEQAFMSCSKLTSISIPNSVLSIGNSAFNSCSSLISVIIPNLVTTIGNSLFAHCSNLTSVIIPNSVTSIQGWGLGGTTSLTSIIIPNSVTTIAADGFINSGLTTVTITNGQVISGITFQAPDSNVAFFGRTVNTIAASVLNSNICFLKGTPVRTDQGLIHIDKINPDVHTIRNKKIVAITKTNTHDRYLVCFEKDSLGPNIPSEKTIITYNHKILYNGKMIKAKHFIQNFENVHDVNHNGELLYNVLLEEPYKMIVNNLICETLHPDNLIAQIYRFLPNMNLKEQEEIITRVNKDCIFAYNY